MKNKTIFKRKEVSKEELVLEKEQNYNAHFKID